jgi:nucleotide-binding universal stress UspA family protein
MSTREIIVVGVDGSGCSRTALEFALDEAVRRDAAVRVLWALPEAEYWTTAYGMSPSTVQELRGSVEKVARGVVEEVVLARGGAVAEVPVEVRALGGAPARVLVSEARDADLLVVGHRGRGTFRSTMLGSVALQCVLHATVPVTVVRSAPSPAPSNSGRDAEQVAEPHL